MEIPKLILGTSTNDLRGDKKTLDKTLVNAIDTALKLGIRAFDSARDYDNEPLLGNAFKKLGPKYGLKREDLYITTKVGNSQQLTRNMSAQIDISLQNFQTDYIDLWMLHWPYPGYFLDNWQEMEDIYKSGKVKAIGLCNCRERHLDQLIFSGLTVYPTVVQFEYHPFRTVPMLVDLCKDFKIHIQAYSSLCCMLPFVTENELLQTLAKKHGKTIAQIILRWHIQQNVTPIFRSFNPERIKSNMDVFDFELTDEEMTQIFSLNTDYKFHPESMNCPGF